MSNYGLPEGTAAFRQRGVAVSRAWGSPIPSLIVPNTGAASPFDLEQLTVLLGNDERVVRELLQLFVVTTSPLLMRLEAAVKEQDSAAVQLAHELRGASATLGAGDMPDLCRQLEASAADGAWTRATALVRMLQREFQRVRSFVEAF